ncbi:MAG: sulfotransferase [Woeseia sp.]
MPGWPAAERDEVRSVQGTATESRNPFVFVVGCPRSGTTLLRRMLDNHPQLTVANDTHFITRAVKKALRKVSDPALTRELVDQVRSYRRFYRMGLDEADIEEAARGCRSYSQFVSRLYDLRAAHKGKPLSGEKTPDYCRQIPALTSLFPRAKFIHIIRDGRDTCLSAMDWATATKGPGKWSLWAEDIVGTCALWWRWQTGTGIRDGHSLGEGLYHELKYEDLVADSQALLSAIAAFLQIPDSEKMADYFAGKTIKNPHLSAKSAWLPPHTGLRDWRNQMMEKDIAVFEGIAGKLLAQLGYEASGADATGGVEKRINRCLDWWQAQKMSQADHKSLHGS